MINIDDRLLEEVNSDELWLLLHIVKRFNVKLICWPSNQTLCTDTEWSLKKMQKVKASLVEKGILVTKTRYFEKSQSSNEYMINTDFMGVYVPAKRIPLGMQADKVGESNLPTHPESNGDSPPESNLLNKVLTSEVLTNEGIVADATDLFGSSKGRVKGNPTKEKLALEHQANVYKPVVDFWLKDFHPGWSFGAVHGKAVKSIIKKTHALFISRQTVPKPDDIVGFFQMMCRNLPEWFKDKDLQIIDSKFNEIVTQIENAGKGKTTANTRTSDSSWIDILYGSAA